MLSKPARPLRRLFFFLLVAACGSRTGLLGDEAFGPGVGVGADNPSRPDASGVDAGEPDVIPQIDARTRDVDRTGCPDADATLIYTITSDYTLRSFDPSSGEFQTIGAIACPAAPNAAPFSMAVDRRGVAFVLFRGDERLYQVSTATAACVTTAYVPGQLGFRLFGMGFATNSVGPTERLYIAGSEQQNGTEGLAWIDMAAFGITKVADFEPRIINAELTGTGDGRLFGFYSRPALGLERTYIGEINTETGAILGETEMQGVNLGGGWAFAFWGGDFYMFTAPNGVSSEVTRYRPSDQSIQVVKTLDNEIIVGAGVSTCAPQ